jgi:hypothetical protein
MRSLLVVTTALTLLAGCASTPRDGISHVVVVWTKNPGDPAARQRLLATSHQLAAQIPEVRTLVAGQPIPKSGPFDDASYDVALVMNFKDDAALAAYHRHPEHQRAVKETLLPLARKIVVYDFRNQ